MRFDVFKFVGVTNTNNLKILKCSVILIPESQSPTLLFARPLALGWFQINKTMAQFVILFMHTLYFMQLVQLFIIKMRMMINPWIVGIEQLSSVLTVSRIMQVWAKPAKKYSLPIFLLFEVNKITTQFVILFMRFFFILSK